MSRLLHAVRRLAGFETSEPRERAADLRSLEAAEAHMRAVFEANADNMIGEGRLQEYFEQQALERGAAMWEDDGIARAEAKLAREAANHQEEARVGVEDALADGGRRFADIMREAATYGVKPDEVAAARDQVDKDREIER